MAYRSGPLLGTRIAPRNALIFVAFLVLLSLYTLVHNSPGESDNVDPAINDSHEPSPGTTESPKPLEDKPEVAVEVPAPVAEAPDLEPKPSTDPVSDDIEQDVPTRYEGGSLTTTPPSHDKIREFEKNLPQHDLDLPFPEGRTGRYVKFNLQPDGQGWNNVLNEWVYITQIAHDSNRAYVFEDYVWAKEHYPWRLPVWPWESGAKKPTTPINALISGPTAGGPWDPDDPAPRAVHASYWDEACPKEERHVINGRTLRAAVRGRPALEIFEHYVAELKAEPARCVEVSDGGDVWDAQVFGFRAISTERALGLMEFFLDKPASRLLAPSALVRSAIVRNEYSLVPRKQPAGVKAPADPFDRMMAVHLRRGDFSWACADRARFTDTYYGWMLWKTIPDKDVHPEGAYGNGTITDDAMAFYMKHCFPNHEQIVARVAELRDEYLKSTKPGPGSAPRTLDMLYLLTNGDRDWVRELKEKLAPEWNTVITSKDIVLDDEQMDVGMAVDMEIGRRAAVFVGNAWSSYSSNVMHTRIRDNREPLGNRVL